jgi:1-phosphofructokinase
MTQPARADALVVFAPSPVLGVTVEPRELHLHAAGQGFWVARMAAELGAAVTLCCPLGGETGAVLAPLIRDAGVSLQAVRTTEANGAYVHDEHDGRRTVLRRVASAPLRRHETDDLYDITLTAALEAGVLLLTGPRDPDLVQADLYRRLATDVARAGGTVLADLTGPALAGALRGGVSLLRISDEEAVDERFARTRRVADLFNALRAGREAGAADVVISRGPKGAIALLGDDVLRLSAPRFAAAEPRGTGDSMFAGIGVGVASGEGRLAGLRLGMAAGALNATRHGLGSGHHEQVAGLVQRVVVQALDAEAILEQPEETPPARLLAGESRRSAW